jgi:precorrin-6x reductase
LTEIVLFGGTAEGRKLGELLNKKRVKTVLCVATKYGESLLAPSDALRVYTGRLDNAAIENLFNKEKPRLAIDATHPYAVEISGNIRAACEKTGIKLLRLIREKVDGDSLERFPRLEELVAWLNKRGGVIFSTLGAKECSALAAVEGYKERVWLRVLPDLSGLSACLAAGFPARHIVCMQGPFSKELNAAMFREAGAEILVTKESGKAGGYLEKLEAAKENGMTVATLARPREENGAAFDDIVNLIERGAL